MHPHRIHAAPTEYVCPTRIQNIAASWEQFDDLPPEVQAAAWEQLRAECDAKTEGHAVYEDVLPAPAPPPKPTRVWTPRPAEPGWNLDDIPTPEYVHRLTGVEAPIRRSVPCPFPDHDDSSASFVAYENGHFNCFGCNCGGRIFDFAAALWGYSGPLRGDVFREVRSRLLEIFPAARAA
jgi:hypothetical protein